MKPPKSEWPYKISQAEFDNLITALTNLWHYDVLTDSQHDQAVNRLEKMYTTKEMGK